MWGKHQRGPAQLLRETKDAAMRALSAKQYARAAELFQTLAQEEPHVPQHRMHLAEMLVKVGSVPGAVAVYRGALQLYLESSDLKKALALCHVILGLSPGELPVRQLKRELLEKLNFTSIPRSTLLPPPPVATPPKPTEELTTEEEWLSFQYSMDTPAKASAPVNNSYWQEARNHAWSAPGDETQVLDPLIYVDEGPTEPHTV